MSSFIEKFIKFHSIYKVGQGLQSVAAGVSFYLKGPSLGGPIPSLLYGAYLVVFDEDIADYVAGLDSDYLDAKKRLRHLRKKAQTLLGLMKISCLNCKWN